MKRDEKSEGELVDLSDRIKDLEDDLEGANEEVSRLESELEDREHDVKALEREVAELEDLLDQPVVEQPLIRIREAIKRNDIPDARRECEIYLEEVTGQSWQGCW